MWKLSLTTSRGQRLRLKPYRYRTPGTSELRSDHVRSSSSGLTRASFSQWIYISLVSFSKWLLTPQCRQSTVPLSQSSGTTWRGCGLGPCRMHMGSSRPRALVTPSRQSFHSSYNRSAGVWLTFLGRSSPSRRSYFCMPHPVTKLDGWKWFQTFFFSKLQFTYMWAHLPQYACGSQRPT